MEEAPANPAGRRTRRVRTVPTDPTIMPDEVRGALRRLVASADFPASARNRRVLAYITEKALQGRAAEITAYAVATEVFGRPAIFNPTTDPIVRIEAGKLRRDLEVYYLKSGAAEEIGIALPRGGYIPSFHRRSPGEVGDSRVTLDPCGITVHALHGGQCALAEAEPGFRARLADLLAREPELAIFAGAAIPSEGGLLDSDTVREVARRNGTRFVLSGDARGQNGTTLFTARLHDGATGRLLWSEDISGPPEMLGEAVFSRVREVRRGLAAQLDGRDSNPGFRS